MGVEWTIFLWIPDLDNLSPSLRWTTSIGTPVQLDQHGGVLLSFRNRSQIVRLWPDDWSIHWKLGGADGDFMLADGDWDGFARQHDVHDLGDGRILLFDNGNFGPEARSRALGLELDTVNLDSPKRMAIRPPRPGVCGPKGAPFDLKTATPSSLGNCRVPEFGTRVTEVTLTVDISMEVRLPPGSNLYQGTRRAW